MRRTHKPITTDADGRQIKRADKVRAANGHTLWVMDWSPDRKQLTCRDWDADGRCVTVSADSVHAM